MEDEKHFENCHGNALAKKECLYVKTPLIESLSRSSASYKTFLKLENCQPSGSFKIRGIGYHCTKAKERGCRHFVSSSGGNAGLAVSLAGRQLNVPTTVFVPEMTPAHVINKMQLEGANVHISGACWDFANEHALGFVKERQDEGAVLIHPFNHPEIWKGHASLVHELYEQLPERPSLIVLSVGGGGLMAGVLQGLHHVGWTNVPVIACETEGADCFNAACDADRIVTLPKISSVAKCLGALTVLQEAFEWRNKHKIIGRRITDRDAVSACLKHADNHYTIVEPACGAALSVMNDDFIEGLVKGGDIEELKTIVVIVCGGHSVKMNDLLHWKKQFDL